MAAIWLTYLINLLTEELGESGFKIYGAVRRLSVKNHENIVHLENHPNFKLINMDLNDAHSMRDVIINIQPDYFINFAAPIFCRWKLGLSNSDLGYRCRRSTSHIRINS